MTDLTRRFLEHVRQSWLEDDIRYRLNIVKGLDDSPENKGCGASANGYYQHSPSGVRVNEGAALEIGVRSLFELGHNKLKCYLDLVKLLMPDVLVKDVPDTWFADIREEVRQLCLAVGYTNNHADQQGRYWLDAPLPKAFPDIFGLKVLAKLHFQQLVRKGEFQGYSGRMRMLEQIAIYSGENSAKSVGSTDSLEEIVAKL